MSENTQTQAVLSNIMESSSRVTTLRVRGLEFVVKYPSLFDITKIGSMRVKMFEGANPDHIDPITDNTAYFLSTMMVVTTKVPAGFNWEKLSDFEFLIELYEEFDKWRNSFRRGDSGGPNAESAGTAKHEVTMEGDAGI